MANTCVHPVGHFCRAKARPQSKKVFLLFQLLRLRRPRCRASVDMGTNHFFSNLSRVEFSNLELDRVEFLVSNFKPNRTEANRA